MRLNEFLRQKLSLCPPVLNWQARRMSLILISTVSQNQTMTAKCLLAGDYRNKYRIANKSRIEIVRNSMQSPVIVPHFQRFLVCAAQA